MFVAILLRKKGILFVDHINNEKINWRDFYVAIMIPIAIVDSNERKDIVTYWWCWILLENVMPSIRKCICYNQKTHLIFGAIMPWQILLIHAMGRCSLCYATENCWWVPVTTYPIGIQLRESRVPLVDILNIKDLFNFWILVLHG